MGALKSFIKLIAEFIVVLGALACILVWLKIEPKDLRIPTVGNEIWLLAAMGLFAIGIGSSVRSWYLSAVSIRDLRRENDMLKNQVVTAPKVYTKPPNRELAIHSAKWVVSNDKQCYIDAAPSLQKHIKESLIDSVDIVLMNDNLGGDPRKDTHKHLRLVYSYGSGTRQEIFKKEREYLVLPEPPDEIQKRILEVEKQRHQKEIEALNEQHKSALLTEYKRGCDEERAYVQTMLKPPEPQLSDAQYHRFDKLRNQFAVLKPAQKIALKKVRDVPGISEFELFTYLTSTLGFEPPVKETIIGPLLEDFVERNSKGEIELKSGKVDWIDWLLKQKPLC